MYDTLEERIQHEMEIIEDEYKLDGQPVPANLEEVAKVELLAIFFDEINKLKREIDNLRMRLPDDDWDY